MKRGSCKGFLFDFLLNSGVLNTVRFFTKGFSGVWRFRVALRFRVLGLVVGVGFEPLQPLLQKEKGLFRRDVE